MGQLSCLFVRNKKMTQSKNWFILIQKIICISLTYYLYKMVHLNFFYDNLKYIRTLPGPELFIYHIFVFLHSFKKISMFEIAFFQITFRWNEPLEKNLQMGWAQRVCITTIALMMKVTFWQFLTENDKWQRRGRANDFFCSDVLSLFCRFFALSPAAVPSTFLHEFEAY